MKNLNLKQCEEIIGGNDFVSGLCTAATIGSLVALTNFWNPVGWISSALVVADVACVAYGIGSNIK